MDYPKKTSAGVGLFVWFLLIKQTTKKKSALRDNFLRRSTLSGVVFYSVFSDFFRDFFLLLASSQLCVGVACCVGVNYDDEGNGMTAWLHETPVHHVEGWGDKYIDNMSPDRVRI